MAINITTKRSSQICQKLESVKCSKSLLDNLSFSSDEFVGLTERYTLRHGVELHHSKIRLHERPMVVQEVISRKVDCVVSTTYGTSLMHGGSTSILNFHEALIC